jgi:hypothetical protein
MRLAAFDIEMNVALEVAQDVVSGGRQPPAAQGRQRRDQRGHASYESSGGSWLGDRKLRQELDRRESRQGIQVSVVSGRARAKDAGVVAAAMTLRT